MSSLKFVSVDRIFNKFTRELKNTELNESDVIDWIGEALEFMKLRQTQEQSLAFVQVKNGEAEMPCGLQYILNVARNNNFEETGVAICGLESSDTGTTTTVVDSIAGSGDSCCAGEPFSESDVVQYYRKTFSVSYAYNNWVSGNTFQSKFTPVILANKSYFDTIVCREKFKELYHACTDEYSIVGISQKLLRFNFDEGQVAISYLSTALDPDTGYPMIPDHISYITAITYYVKWKIYEWKYSESEQGAQGKMQYFQAEWLKYCIQGKTKLRLKEIYEQRTNILEQSHKLSPRRGHYNYFGNVGSFQGQF